MTAITLTQDQHDAADRFFDFLMSNEKVFMISGGAGCGKTFLMSHLVNVVMQNYQNGCKMLGIEPEYTSVAFTATTNKAAEVLENNLQMPVSTIHKYLGLKVYDDFKTGKSKISKTHGWRPHENIIMFIDEWSMIDTALYEIILESFPRSKVVFVGDHAQLSPVGEKESPVLKDIDPKNFTFLSEPVRNAGSPDLVALCSQLRHTVETGVFAPIQSSPSARYVSASEMEQLLHQHFKHDNPSCRVLCHTNDRVRDYNDFIRKDVRGKPLDIQVNDVLVVAQTMALPGDTLNVEREVRVLDVGPVESDPRFIGEWPDGNGIQYHNVRVELMNSYQSTYTLRVPLKMERVNQAKKHYAKNKDWTIFFDLKNSYADLRDKAACTVHKSQGSTYDTVFVDLGNIGTSFDPDAVARMLFVAVSRARSQVYFYGRLPGRYQGSKVA